MENLGWFPTNGKKAMEEELIRGRDMANQLLEVLTFDDKSNNIREVKGSYSKSSKVLPLDVAQDLVREVLKSLTNTLLYLNKREDSNDVSVIVGDFSFSTNCHKMEGDLDGAYKQLQTLKNKSPKGSKKRKLCAPTWEKTTLMLIDDGYTWRKYGQKAITNTKYFRNYYKCTNNDQHCKAMKHVQRTRENPPLYKTTYYGHHTCKSYFQLDTKSEPISSCDSSMLLSFDTKVPNKQENLLPISPPSPSPSLPLLISSEEDSIEAIQDDNFLQNLLFPYENLQLCEFDVYTDYLTHGNILPLSDSF